MTSNTRYAVWDSNGTQTRAIIERSTSNPRYAVGSIIVGDGRRDSDGARVFVGVVTI